MNQQFKLLFSLLTALAVAPLIATSDTPSSSSSSSTANMSDTAESTRAKRKTVGPSYEEDEAEERSLMHAQKLLRSSNSPSSMADNSGRPENASSSALIANNESNLSADLHGQLGAPIPAWFYVSPFFKISFEHLNYADLTVARSVSKAFHAMAPQVLMPTGQDWVTQFTRRFARAKTATEKYNAYRDIVSAVGRCRNPSVSLQNIIKNYYTQVPYELRFWYGEKDKFPVEAKDNLRDELGTVLDEIEKAEAEKQRNCQALRQQANQTNAARELDEFNTRYEKILRPLKEKQARKVDALMPSLRVLCPYATASMIVHELNGQQLLPDILPLVHEKDEELDARALYILAKKLVGNEKLVAKECVSALAAACVPSVHASLVIQKDRAGLAQKKELEYQFIRPMPFDELDPARRLDMIGDELKLQVRLVKLEQLKQARNDVILDKRSISKREIEKIYWDQKRAIQRFLFTRINAYVKELELGKLPNEITTAHIHTFIKTLLTLIDPKESGSYKLISDVCGPWHSFIESLNPVNRDEIWQKIAYFADKAVELSISKNIWEFEAAAIAHVRARDIGKADQYYDQLFAEFGNAVDPLQYFTAGLVSTALASNYHKNNQLEKANQHWNTAAKRLNRSIHLISRITSLKALHDGVQISRNISKLISTKQENIHPQVLAKIQECHAAIDAKSNELEKAAIEAANNNNNAG